MNIDNRKKIFKLLGLKEKATRGCKEMKQKIQLMERGGFLEGMKAAQNEYDKYVYAINEINSQLDNMIY